jgi:hypothetical protein
VDIGGSVTWAKSCPITKFCISGAQPFRSSVIACQVWPHIVVAKNAIRDWFGKSSLSIYGTELAVVMSVGSI